MNELPHSVCYSVNSMLLMNYSIFVYGRTCQSYLFIMPVDITEGTCYDNTLILLSHLFIFCLMNIFVLPESL